jgi:hypothetical protein
VTATLAGPYVEAVQARLGERATPDVLAVADALERNADKHGRTTLAPVGLTAAAGLDTDRTAAAFQAIKTVDLAFRSQDGRFSIRREAATNMPPLVTSVSDEPRSGLRTPTREVDYRCSVMDHPGLSVGARYTGVAIVRHCFRKLELFAGMDTVAEWIGLSPESRKQAGKYVAELADAGFLDPIGKAGRSTKYRLTIPQGVDAPH